MLNRIRKRFKYDPGLIKAAKIGNLEQIKDYLNKGADVNAKNHVGECVLAIAMSSGNLECVKYLLQAGANSLSRDNYGTSPIDILKYTGNQEMCELFFQYDTHYCATTDVRLRNHMLTSMLQGAACSGNKALAQIALENGADIEGKQGGGWITTPLAYAVRHRHPEVVKFLLESGADINAKENGRDGKHNTLFEIIDEYGPNGSHFKEISELLQAAKENRAIAEVGKNIDQKLMLKTQVALSHETKELASQQTDLEKQKHLNLEGNSVPNNQDVLVGLHQFVEKTEKEALRQASLLNLFSKLIVDDAEQKSIKDTVLIPEPMKSIQQNSNLSVDQLTPSKLMAVPPTSPRLFSGTNTNQIKESVATPTSQQKKKEAVIDTKNSKKLLMS